jgi:hypothetical protein
VVLLSTLHKTAEFSDHEDAKPAIILDYNHNKGGLDNLILLHHILLELTAAGG